MVWKWAPILFNSAVSLLGRWPRAGIPPRRSQASQVVSMAVIWAACPCYIVMSPSPLAVHSADCSVVLSGSVLRGSCIILHDLLVCQRGGYTYTVAYIGILQLPPRIKWDIPYAFQLSLGKTSDETSAVCLVSNIDFLKSVIIILLSTLLLHHCLSP